MLSFKEFRHKYNLENRATNGQEILDVVKKLKLECNIYLRNDKLKTKQGIINLSDDPYNGTHWVAYFGNNYFDSYCVEPPQEIKQQLKKNSNKGCVEAYISPNEIQKNNSLCASYCLYFLYLMNKGLSFKSSILKMLFINERE